MATEVKLPQLGQTMEEGTIVGCMVKVGDEVKKGDVIFEIETDKATLEIESPAAGFVKHILGEIDQTLPVGDVLLVLGEKDEKVPQSFVDSLKAGVPAVPAAEAAPAGTIAELAKPQPQPAKDTGKVIASPRAKKLAKDLGVELAAVVGTGSGGRVTEQDVKKATSAGAAEETISAAEAKLGDTVLLTKKQKIIAQRMLRSKREIPCFYLSVRADVTDLVGLRTKMNESGSGKISYNDFMIRAVAIGLERFSLMTGQLKDEALILPETVNVGLAVAATSGLVVPVVKDAQKKSVRQIAIETKALIEKAQDDKLLLTDLEGACITVSNLGSFGIDCFIPIVIPGQCSILGVGQITNTCVPDNGDVAVRKLVNLTLSVDHRIANGMYAGRFLDFVRKLLEDTSTFV